MADGLGEPLTLAVIGLILAVIVVTFIELKYLRKSMKARRVRAAKRVHELPDDAYNALVTTRAIQNTLARGGVVNEEVAALLREAQAAFSRQNYRVVLDLTSKARERLLALKARQTAQGDLAKLEGLPPGGEEVTTKELLTKEFPPNYAQSKFSMELAGSAIAAGREAGRDVANAEGLLAQADVRFRAQDYTGALALARQAQKAAAGEAVAAPPPPPAPAPAAPIVSASRLACKTCGSTLQADDVFCRKCGSRVGPVACGTCGAELVADDAFCRKCGARVRA